MAPRQTEPLQPPLVLASASPRRRELLERVGLEFVVLPSDVDESTRPGEPADEYVARVALDKALAASMDVPDSVVLAADTAVVLDGEALGKPTDAADALSMLGRLAGRTHTVMTAVVVRAAAARDGIDEPINRAERATQLIVARAEVTVAEASSEELAWYVSTGEPMDKAGAYAVQGIGAFLVERVDGDPTTVIGLPLRTTLEMLRAAGLRWPTTGPGPSI